MTDLPPPSPDDKTPPTVLEEPFRPDALRDFSQNYSLQPEEAGVVGLHPGWAAVLAGGEVPLWQGRPRQDPHRSVFSNLPALFIVFVLLVLMLQSGSGAGLLPFAVLGYIAFRLMRKSRPRVAVDQVYLVTNRAAYVASSRGDGLHDVSLLPITPDLRPRLAARAVLFEGARGAGGQGFGFHDISDAAQVHDLIRTLQKGQR